MRLLVLALFCLALGCHRRAVVEEETVVTTAPPTSGGVVVVSASGYTSADGMCTATLSVYDVSTGASCTIDERVTGAPGYLSYPCAGGAASANFGGSVFTGTVDAAGNVIVEINTGFPFSDGCDWETKQTIRGSLGVGILAYEYREEPVPGQRGCASACLGTASVRVSR